MRSYEERAKYILKQRDKRLEKRRRIRSAVSISAVTAFSVAAIAGITVLVNRIEGKNGAILISPNDSSAVSNTSGSNNSSDSSESNVFTGEETGLPAEKIYPRNNDDIERILEINDDFSFTMHEFPNDKFRLEKGTLYKGDLILYSGQPIHSLYLADLNGDGRREICSDVSIGLSGVVDMHIVAFDVASGSLYSLSGSTDSEYHITFEDGKIGFEQGVYSSEAIFVDQKGELTLSVMSKQMWSANREETKNQTEPASEMLYRRGSSDRDNFPFTMPEYPDYTFELRDNAFYINGKETFIGNTIESIYLADLNGDGCREICFDAQTGWELGESMIVAIECKTGERRELSKIGCCYTITVNYGELHYEYRRCENTDSTPKGKLTLDIMGKG